MNSKRAITILVTLLTATIPLIHCGEKQTEDVQLSGDVIIQKDIYDAIMPESPIFVAISTSMDRDAIENRPLDIILELAEATPDLLSTDIDEEKFDFYADLSQNGAKPGDQVYLFAFVDKGYTGGIPNLTVGDIMGFYIDPNNFDMALTLEKGKNNFAEILVNRAVYDFDASVAGTITTTEPGKIILVAYAGEINSLNFDNINIDDVIGYEKITAQAGTSPYSFDILPYGYDVPINNVYVFAFLDKNGNGHPDAGDMWGTASDEDGYPITVTIEGDTTTNLDLIIDHEITESSGVEMRVIGNFVAPAGYDSDSPPVFIIICKAENPNAIFADTLDTVKYFEKITPGQTSFNLNITDSGLNPGDEVMIIAMWDKDFVYGFPRLSEGDMIGYYTTEETYSYQYTLDEGDNTGISIELDKTYQANNARVNGTILGDDSGKIIIVAYTGQLDSYDLDLDMNKIIGYEEMTKGAVPTDYSMDILPFTDLPVEDVYIFAFLDNDSDGEPDAGDKWGSYNDAEGYPITIDITDAPIGGIDITIDNEISEPSGYNISLQGSFTAPADYNASSAPVFMIVCQADDPEQIFENTMDTVKYFEKLPAGQKTFNIDLSKTDLIPGDEVMIIALWDRDYVKGFPYLSEGDMIGYYINEDDYTYQYALVDGINSGITLDLVHPYKENSATVQGNILGSETGDVIIIAYTGEFNSLDTTLDTNKIIGYETVTKGTSPIAYSMELMPFVSSFPVTNAFIFAILDVNRNGIPDNGDRLGFYTNNENQIPSLVTLQDSANTGFNIEFLMNYVEPTTGGTPMTLSGAINAPSGYNTNASSRPIFIIIATAENTFDLFNDPMSAMKYFVKLPQGTTTYNIDLSGTGLVPGDEIRILALWDRDYVAGFPNPNAGDKIGYYQNKSTFNFSKVLTAGANYANLTGGWSLGVNKTLYDHDAHLSFKFNQSVSGSGNLSASLIQGREVLVVTIYEAGVDDTWDFWVSAPSYGITDMDYITSIEYLTIPNTSTWQNNTYTVGLFPFIYDSIPLSSNPLRMSNVYIYVILDSNGNGWPDSGEYVGFYWTWYMFNKIPEMYPTMYYDRTNTLPNGEVVTFTTRTY